MKIEECIAQLKAWDDAYYNRDDEVVSDAIYDAFKASTKKLAPDHSYFKTVGAPLSSTTPRAWKKVKHLVPMGSLNKVQTEEEFRTWYKKVGSPRLHWSDKCDGISISLRYKVGKLVQAVTRGDGLEGEDITVNVRKMRGVPKSPPQSMHVRGEIAVLKDDFEKYFKGYKNRRNAAGGAAKDFKGERCAHLTVLCYEVILDAGPIDSKFDEFALLNACGFLVPTSGVVSDATVAVRLYQNYIDEYRNRLDYDIDGLVFEIDDNEERSAYGETDHRPEGARAFKFPSVLVETTLRDIIWQVGASGRITPVAVFDSVDLGGTTVTRATLHNINYIVQLARSQSRTFMAPGDTVRVARSNDVIPQIVGVVGSSSSNCFVVPTTCPICGHLTERVGEYLICSNQKRCDAQVAGTIKRWVRKLGVKDVGDALIEVLCDLDIVKEPADLYRLTVEDLENVQMTGRRLGESSATTAVKNLHARMELPLHVLVGSLGIPLWSRSMCKLLIRAGYDNLEKLYALRTPELINLEGVEVTKAEAFVIGLYDVKPFIDHLLEVGITVAKETEGIMKGKSVCFTGFRDAELSAAVEATGGIMKSSVSKGLTYLVAKNPTVQSTKLTKAKENGTEVISVETLKEMLKG